jgi:hypothetical protein
MAMPNLLVETSVDIRLSDNLLCHTQMVYGVGLEVARAAQHRARFGVEPDSEVAQAIARSPLATDAAAALVVPRLLVLACDTPTLDGLRRALTRPRLPVLAGEVVARVGRATLRLRPDALALMWRACEQAYESHYRAYWDPREPDLRSLAREADDRLSYAEIPHKLAHLTRREPPHADIEVYLLDSEALLSYADGGERVCISTAVLSRFERFAYVFAHECARIYLYNPPWWEVEPCASACQGLAGELIDAVESCAAQYLAATLALGYGPDPGFWVVHPQVEAAISRRWPAFVAAPEKGIDLLLERVLEELRAADPGAPAVHPLRLSVTCDEGGFPVHCTVSDRRF